MKRFVLAICFAVSVLGAQEFGFQAREAGKGDESYQRGLSALDAHEWDRAIQEFDESAAQKKNSAPAALYWKAYAQNKAGQKGPALETVALLKSAYPSSKWNKDAGALAVEVQAQTGEPANPSAQADEDLKLIALNSLMQADSQRALPILKKLLAGNSSDKVKDRALFVLVQNGSPEASKLIADTARGTTHPELQLKAIKYMGMMGNDASRKELSSVYAAAANKEVKRAILKSFMISGSRGQLLDAAKNESDPSLRHEAIRQLAIAGGSDELWQLYAGESTVENKKEILKSMFLTGNADRLSDLAKSEKDPALRASAIKSLGLMSGKVKTETLTGIYKSDPSEEVRRAVLEALFLQQNGKGLVDLARAEKNPQMKQAIVAKMALVHSKEVTEYMEEVLR